MSNVTYINTQEIRQDLMGFLRSIEAGHNYVVLNRSKRVASLTSWDNTTAGKRKQSVKEALMAADISQLDLTRDRSPTGRATPFEFGDD